jgi:hypothetical protein
MMIAALVSLSPSSSLDEKEQLIGIPIWNVVISQIAPEERLHEASLQYLKWWIVVYYMGNKMSKIAI